MGQTDREPAGRRELEPVRHADPELAQRGDLEPGGSRGGAEARAGLQTGEEVLITGGIFRGQRGVIEGALPSGKLRVRVETRRGLASARVDPAHLEPLGIVVEGSEETD